MGIDRHEWEHRNYKSGRTAVAPAQLADEDAGQLAVDASLGEAPVSPAPSKPETSKAKAKAAPKESAKESPKEKSGVKSKTPSKTNAKATSGGKRSARAG